MLFGPGRFRNLLEKWVRLREFLVLYGQVRKELYLCHKRSRVLRRKISRLETRIPIYIEMLSAVEEKKDAAIPEIRGKLDRELEALLATLEGHRKELDLLQRTRSFQANRMELELLEGLYPKRVLLFQSAIVVLLLSCLGILLPTGIRFLGRASVIPTAQKLLASTTSIPPSIPTTLPTPLTGESPTQGPAKARSVGPTPILEPTTEPTVTPSPASSPVPSTSPASSERPCPVRTELTHSEPVVRWHAWNDHVRHGTASVKELLEGLQDPDPRIRGLVASALGQFDQPKAIEALRQRRSDPEPYVRLIVEESLRQIQERSVESP